VCTDRARSQWDEEGGLTAWGGGGDYRPVNRREIQCMWAEDWKEKFEN
jgi:hypothetical protein